MLEDWEDFYFYRSLWRRVQGNSQECEEKIGKTSWLPRCRVKDIQASWKRAQSRRLAMKKRFKSMYDCTVESHESARRRVESSRPKNHDDHIAGKGFTSMSHHNLVHKFIPVAQAMKIPDAKEAVDKEWKKARDDPSMEFGRSQEQKGGDSGSTKRHKESPLCHIDGHLPPQKSRVGTQITEAQKQSRAPGGHFKTRLWSLCSFFWPGLVCVPDDCRKMMDVIAGLPGCDGQAAVAVSASFSGKIGGCSQIAQNSWIGMSRRLDTSSTTQVAQIMEKHWRSVVPLERNLYGHPLAGLCWEIQIEEALLELGWEKKPNWECMFVHRKHMSPHPPRSPMSGSCLTGPDGALLSHF